VTFYARRLCGEVWNDEMSHTVSHTKTILNVLQYRQKNVYYLCDFPAVYADMEIYQFIVVVIIIITTTFMQDIYNHMPETNQCF
jgi:hypothetical protein